VKYVVPIILISVFTTSILRGEVNPMIELNNQNEALRLNGFISEYIDNEGTLSPQQLHDSSFNKKWQPFPTDYWQTGYVNNYYWLRLEVTASEELNDEWYWWLDATIMHDVRLYAFEGNKLIFADTSGVNFPFYQRNIVSRYPVIPIRPHKGQKVTLYARYHNEVGSIKGYLKLTSKADFNIIDLKESTFYIGFYTFLLVSCLFSAALWFFWKEKIYLFFAAYILSSMFMSAGFKGFSFIWLWPNVPHLAFISRSLWALGTVGFFLKFVYALLFDDKIKKTWLSLWIDILTGILSVFGIISLFKINLSIGRVLVGFGNLTFMTSMLTMFVVIFMARRQYKLTALFFLIAFTPLTFVGIGILLHNNKIYPNILGQSEMPFVLAQMFEILFLFVALFKRFQTMKAIQERQEQMEIQAKQQVQDERERISRELHDNVGARLTHLITQIDHVEFRLGRDKTEKSVENTLGRLETLGENARDAMNVLRETIWAVKEEAISLENFTSKISGYLQQQFSDNLDFEVHLIGDNKVMLTPGQALNMFRIVQEACQNTFKHATATQIHITISTIKDTLIIAIKDNGKGFDTAHSNGEEHNGLRNMKHRATEIGADFDIQSCLGKGTEVVIKTTIIFPTKSIFQNTNNGV
jgi:two-component system, sensor histidine kinase LadS